MASYYNYWRGEKKPPVLSVDWSANQNYALVLHIPARRQNVPLFYLIGKAINKTLLLYHTFNWKAYNFQLF